MKKQLVLTLLVFAAIATTAQTVLRVQPGMGTLNTAINTYKGTRIYQLDAGEWYGLNAPIENVDYHLKIVGSEPSVLGGMIATLQTGSDVNGVAFDKMFNAKGDITLKNIYFVNADLTEQVAANFIIQSKANTQINIDRCVLHPAGVSTGIKGDAINTKTYFTNNIVIDFGHQLNPNDGHFFWYGNTTLGAGLDSLYVENNTFVCMGMNVFFGGFGDLTHNYVNFNHNSFVFSKSQLDWATKKNEEYWTNNLFFDVQTQPYSNSWQPMPGGDAAMPKPNLIFAAPLPNETMPSTRKNFVQYNSHYRAKGFYDLITELNNFAKTKNIPNVYLFPLVWSKDSVNCREAQMFNSSNYPGFKYGNTITDIDPAWIDTRIYDNETKFISWTRPASYIHALSQPSGNYPPATEWSQYWWIPSGDISNNSVWPVFNGKYTNPQTLTGSIENLPLGDLNWFPASKSVWLSNKSAIEAHIKAGNTFKINLTGVKNTEYKENGFYPNPAKNIISIVGSQNVTVSILNLNGAVLKSVSNVSQVNVSDLANGCYLVKIEDSNIIRSAKLIINR